MQKLKEIVDILCQPKVAAMVGVTVMVVGGFLHNGDLGATGLVIVACAALWAWAAS